MRDKAAQWCYEGKCANCRNKRICRTECRASMDRRNAYILKALWLSMDVNRKGGKENERA